MKKINAELLTKGQFTPFGDILETNGRNFELINDKKCKKFGNLSTIKIQDNDAAGISIFESKSQKFPILLDFMERHPLGSQAFMPLHNETFLIIVAINKVNLPGPPRAFITDGSQGVNIHPNIWHGVLCPLERSGRFLVVDRLKTESNLAIHKFSSPFEILNEL